MGTDVWSESGVVLTLDNMVRAIPKRGLSTIVQAVKKHAEKNIEESPRFKCILDVGSDRQEFMDAVLAVSAISHENDLEDDYEYDCDGHIVELWNIIIKKSHPDMPHFELRVFDNGRESGYGVPIGEPVFIFGKEKLLKQVLTEKGKKFKKLFGSCSENRWSVMSY